MPEPVQYWRTLSGKPPNGGVPPGTAFFASVEHPAAPIQPVGASPPPYSMNQYTAQLDPRMSLPLQRLFLPPQQTLTPPPSPASSTPPPIYMQYFPIHAQSSSPPPSPAPPALAPAPAPAQWSLPGATLLGQPAPTFGGVDYLYPRDHTVIHVILDMYMKLDTPIRLPRWEAKLFPTGLTVRELIKQLGAPDEDENRYGVMEVHEMGDGVWTPGQVILLGSEYAKKTLSEIGWAETRGFAARPVWLKIHKAD